jgi:hypothetical protein
MSDQIIANIKEILSTHKNVGIFVSGGLDSALLVYLCHKYSTDNIFTYFTVPRTDDSIIHAKRVLDTILGENNYSSIHLGNPDVPHDKQVLSGIISALTIPNVDVLLLADTTNPTEKLSGLAPVRVRSIYRKIVQPFFKLTKVDTIQCCIDIDATFIFDISHTCTESKLLRCNECWQCNERSHSFKICNYTDTGTM